MWPMLLDYTRDECKRILRKLELEAYASVVSAFRAQGNLTKEKKKMLQDLSSALSISLERHRAEVRRAVNDERLTTIADRITGPNTSTEWAIEGRRLIPLMPRLVPQTAFTAIANNAANTQAAKNAAMPPPCTTGSKEIVATTTTTTTTSTTTCHNGPPTPPRTSTPTQPFRNIQSSAVVSGSVTKTVNHTNSGNNSVLVLPSGMSIHIKASENNNEEDPANKKRKRSSSLDSVSSPQKVMVPSSPVHHSSVHLPQPHPITTVASDTTSTTSVVVSTGSRPPVTVTTSQASGNTRTVALPVGQSSVKVTLTTASQKFTNTISTSHTPKQVILFSTTGASISPSILQRVPIVKTVSTTSTTLTTLTALHPKPLPSVSVAELSSASSQNPFTTNALLSNSMTSSSSSTSIVTTAIPVLSTPGGSTQTVSTTTAPIASAALHRTKPKTLPPPRQHPRIRHSAVVSTQNQAPLITQNTSLHLPSPPNAQSSPRAQSPSPRAHSPASKALSPVTSVQQSSRSQSPVSTTVEMTLTAHSSVPTTVQAVPRSHSPAASLQIVSRPPSQISNRTHLSQTIQSVQSLPRVPVQQSQNNNSFSRSATQALQVLQSALPKVPSQIIQSFTSVRPSTQFVHNVQTAPRISTPPLQTVHPSVSHSQIKSSCGGKTAIHFKQEGGVKIITQNVPVSTSKILPKPCGNAVVIVSCSPSTYSAANRLTTVSSAGTPRFLCHFGTANTGNNRIGSIPSTHSQALGTRMLGHSQASGIPRASTALKVTLPAGTLGTATIMKSTSAGVKPNVIVVHKAQLWPQGQGTTIVVSSAGPVTKIPEAVQEAVTYFQRQERGRTGGLGTFIKSTSPSQSSVLHTTPSVSDTATLYSSSHIVPSTSSCSSDIADIESVTSQPAIVNAIQIKKKDLESKPLIHETKTIELSKKNTLLADLIQAAGILPDSSASSSSVVATNESLESSTATTNTTPSTSVISLPSSDASISQAGSVESVVGLDNAVVLEGEVTASSQVLGLSEWIQQTAHEVTSPSPTVHVVSNEGKNQTLVDESKEEITGLDSNSALSIQEISLPLEHLREGQILEIQAQDATEILSQPGQLSKEVLELLQQAGLQIQQVEVAPAETEIISESVQTSEIEIPATIVNQETSDTSRDSHPDIADVQDSSEDNEKLKKHTSDDSHYKNEDADNLKSEDHSPAVVDIFSTALASAQLDLDALEFVEDVISQSDTLPSQDSEQHTDKSDSAITELSESTTSGSELITLQLPQVSIKGTSVPTASHIPSSRPATETIIESNCNISLKSHMTCQSQSSITSVVLPQVKCASQLINSGDQSPLFSSVSSQQDLNGNPSLVQVKKNSVDQKNNNIANTALNTSEPETKEKNVVAVVVETLPVVSCISGPSPAVVVSNVDQSGLDTSTMNLEDFTSQQVEGDIREGAEELLVGEALVTIDQIESSLPSQIEHRTEQQEDHEDSASSASTSSCPSSTPVRKKKRIIPEEHVSLSPYLTGWARVASGLLERVSKFRGTGRSKGVFASHWFIHPVSPEEAPGYHEVIQQPMDFSTIKRKLENGCYRNLTEFHADMMLVKNNCELYNPPGHEARDDCDEVFAFYLQEYNRLVEKWQKSHLLSSPKRAKTS